MVALRNPKTQFYLHSGHSTRTISAEGCTSKSKKAISPAFRALDTHDLRRGFTLRNHASEVLRLPRNHEEPSLTRRRADLHLLTARLFRQWGGLVGMIILVGPHAKPWHRPARIASCSHCEANWVWTGGSAGSVKNILTKALDPKVLRPEEAHKRDGSLCFSLVFLLSYYAQKFVDRKGGDAHTQSFYGLHLICCELRHLQAKEPLSGSVTEVTRLAKLQSLHQQKFCQAYGQEWCRPKHHVRMHLPSAIMALKAAPSQSARTRARNFEKSSAFAGQSEPLREPELWATRVLASSYAACICASQPSQLLESFSDRTYKESSKRSSSLLRRPRLEGIQQGNQSHFCGWCGAVGWSRWPCGRFGGGTVYPCPYQDEDVQQDSWSFLGASGTRQMIESGIGLALAVWWRKTQNRLLCLHWRLRWYEVHEVKRRINKY